MTLEIARRFIAGKWKTVLADESGGGSGIPQGGPLTEDLDAGGFAITNQGVGLQREQISGQDVTINNGGTGFLTWDNNSGGTAVLLNLADPLNPVVITAGIYAVTVECIVLALTAGGWFRLRLGLDTEGDDPEVSTSATAPATTACVSMSYYVPAGGVLQAFVENEDGAASRNFRIVAVIQRID